MTVDLQVKQIYSCVKKIRKNQVFRKLNLKIKLKMKMNCIYLKHGRRKSSPSFTPATRNRTTQ